MNIRYIKKLLLVVLIFINLFPQNLYCMEPEVEEVSRCDDYSEGLKKIFVRSVNNFLRRGFSLLCALAAASILVDTIFIHPAEAAIVDNGKKVMRRECMPYRLDKNHYDACMGDFHACSMLPHYYAAGNSVIEYRKACKNGMRKIWQLSGITGKPFFENVEGMNDDDYYSYGPAKHEITLPFIVNGYITICNLDHEEFLVNGFYRCRWVKDSDEEF